MKRKYCLKYECKLCGKSFVKLKGFVLHCHKSHGDFDDGMLVEVRELINKEDGELRVRKFDALRDSMRNNYVLIKKDLEVK